jgi:hypothetical protein
VLLATTICLPHVLLAAPTIASSSSRDSVVDRLRPHFWLGFSIAPLTFVHLWPAMSEGWVRRVEALGLYMASLAFLLSIVQVVVGLRLGGLSNGPRRRLRRVHYWTMAGVAGLALGHVGINSAALRVIFWLSLPKMRLGGPRSNADTARIVAFYQSDGV